MLVRNGKKRRVLTMVAATMQVVLQVAAETSSNDLEYVEQERVLLHEINLQSAAFIAQMTKELMKGLGYGRSRLERMPTISMPKSEAFDAFVILPDKFRQECGFSPMEFGVLLAAVMEVLHMCRDTNDEYGPVLNAARKRRRFKYSARERLFMFLCCACIPAARPDPTRPARVDAHKRACCACRALRLPAVPVPRPHEQRPQLVSLICER